MNDNFEEYLRMKQEGVSPEAATLHARRMGIDEFAQIRMLRSVFGLTLPQAKEVTIRADGQNISLSEYQQRLFPALKAALDSK